jgi:hypothetical protein
MNPDYRNSVLWLIYRIEIPELKKRLLQCIVILDTGDPASPLWQDALKEVEAFGRKHLI